MTFAIGEHDFLLHGEPFRILSGSIHYFRVHPDLWADRIRKARQMGLNTIETYVAWNAHAPREDEFDLSGGLDLGAFLDAVAAEGMYAIVRPGPYICAEWTNGGLPAWLFSDSTTGVRQDEPRYMSAVTTSSSSSHQCWCRGRSISGGPIILVQVENEYGAYGADKTYLRKLVAVNRRIGITVPLTSVDQPTDDMLENGSIPELHRTGSFGSRSPERLDTLRRHQPTGPLMCSEFWDGWFDDWGSHHHLTSVEDTARSLDELLERGASVNIYMFHGGTNFGFTNGANDKGTYLPIVTSYDYDAPLDEAGNPTEKYWAMRDVIAKYAPVGDEKPQPAPAPPAFTAPIRRILPLWDMLDVIGSWTTHEDPPTMDSLSHFEGFAVYRTTIDVTGPAVLHVDEVRDRAQLFLNEDSLGVLARDHHDTTISLPAAAKGRLDLLVEDQGRVDYGPRIGEAKGLIGEASINGRPLRSWSVLPLELNDITPAAQALESSGWLSFVAGPAFVNASFDHPGSGDLYLDTATWGKGVAWVNGFCLGRYWSRGPQRTLYIPGPVLHQTGNEIILFELQATTAREVSFVSAPELGHTEA